MLILVLLMSLTPTEKPHEVVRALLALLASGSYLAVTHTTADLDPLALDGYVRAATDAGTVFTPRSKPDVERFLHDLELVPPGVPVLAWRPDAPPGRDTDSVYTYVGLGRKP